MVIALRRACRRCIYLRVFTELLLMVHWRQASGQVRERSKLLSPSLRYILRGGKPLPLEMLRDQASVCETYISTSVLATGQCGRGIGWDIVAPVATPGAVGEQRT